MKSAKPAVPASLGITHPHFILGSAVLTQTAREWLENEKPGPPFRLLLATIIRISCSAV
jgi:hypothetical protein